MTQVDKGKTIWQDFLSLIRQSQKTYWAIKTKLSHFRKECLREQGYKTKQKTGTSV